MKRAKKRWAWKARHTRPHFKNWRSRPDDGAWYHRHAQRRHRSQTQKPLWLFSKVRKKVRSSFLITISTG